MTTLSAKEVAREFGTDARTIRKFFRSGKSPVDPVGQGNRYEIAKKDLKAVRKAFVAWSNRTSAKKIHVPVIIEGMGVNLEDHTDEEIEEAIDQYLDLDDLEGPTDEELADIELDDL